ncbi:hypothetical protein CON36_31250 [Bacillus cereus]|uniref:HD domain-containing protein n=2 Tax=Bacillus cereus group TaxID=86661 RepID=A0A9X6ZSX1_BACTU|nr:MULTISPECIES: AAA family ATPase [Bacillus cereus group]PDZ94921.1 hypothetical protein CON36_31250 [Bacillus cereus]PFJ38837.1 hypothetical protein COJ15_17320 [Bacillus thuringiensis]
MPKVYMMIGMPGSGKSYESEKIAKEENVIYLSSDKLRKELFGDESVQQDPHLVFSELERRLKDAISQGKNVVYDATNVSRKRRIAFIKQFKKNCEIIAYVFLTPFEICVERDKLRERTVGIDVITRMYKNFQMPLKGEGFSEVIYKFYKEDVNVQQKDLTSVLLENKSYEIVFETLRKLPEFNSVWELPQDSTYHSFSASRHIYYVYDQIHKEYQNEKKIEMLYAGIFHDVGKGFCKSFFNYKGEQTRYANFLGHENVSAYLVMHYLWNLGFDEIFIKTVMELVSLHMYPKNLSLKVENNLKGWVGEEQYRKIVLFNNYDDNAK